LGGLFWLTLSRGGSNGRSKRVETMLSWRRRSRKPSPTCERGKRSEPQHDCQIDFLIHKSVEQAVTFC
jgi:hypothetical protein